LASRDIPANIILERTFAEEDQQSFELGNEEIDDALKRLEKIRSA